LSNEKKVRIAARQEGFKVTGTIGVLLKGLKEGMVSKSEAEGLFKKMKTEKEFRIHPDILDKAMKALDDFQ
jgi:predicted nucleic acid-binding protein